MKLRRNLIVTGLVLACLGYAGWPNASEAVSMRDQIEQRMRENSGDPELMLPRYNRNARDQFKNQSPVDPEMVDATEMIDPRKFPVGSRVLANQSYGPNPLQKLDIYAPESPRNAPILVMVHGGAWKVGDKANAAVVQNKALHWLPKGYIFASVNYRLSPFANPLMQTADIMAAMAWIQKNAPMWGGDPGKIILMGHSAGGHLVALAAADPEAVVKAGIRPWRGTIILDSAALDVVQTMKQRHFGFYDDVFGKDANLWEAASPLHQLKTGVRPMLIICTPLRKKSCESSQSFSEAVQKLGTEAVVTPVSLTHAQINTELGLPGPYTEVVEKVMSVMLETPYDTVSPAPAEPPPHAPQQPTAPAR